MNFLMRVTEFLVFLFFENMGDSKFLQMAKIEGNQIPVKFLKPI